MGRKPVWPPTIHRHVSGQAYVRHKGVTYYLGKHGSPEAQQRYLQVLNELVASGHASTVHQQSYTVTDVCAAFLVAAERSHTPKERGQYAKAVEPLLALYGDLDAREFGARQLGAVQAAMFSGSWMGEDLRCKRGKRHAVRWSARVTNRQVVRLRTLWRWAETQGFAPAGSWNHLRSVPGLRDTAPRRQAVPWGHVLPAATAASDAVRDMILLQWWSGMRPSEVCRMRTADIGREGDVWLYRPASHKMQHAGQDRVVPLGGNCQAILRRWLDDDAPLGHLFRPSNRHGGHRLHFTPEVYSQAVRRACDKAGVPRWSPYQLRHACKARLTREAGLDHARAVLGQKSLGATNLYASEQDVQAATEAARRLC